MPKSSCGLQLSFWNLRFEKHLPYFERSQNLDFSIQKQQLASLFIDKSILEGFVLHVAL
jgi:hypothetical protein